LAARSVVHRCWWPVLGARPCPTQSGSDSGLEGVAEGWCWGAAVRRGSPVPAAGGLTTYPSAWRQLSGCRYPRVACRCRAPGSRRSQRASGRAGTGCRGRSAAEGGRESGGQEVSFQGARTPRMVGQLFWGNVNCSAPGLHVPGAVGSVVLKLTAVRCRGVRRAGKSLFVSRRQAGWRSSCYKAEPSCRR